MTTLQRLLLVPGTWVRAPEPDLFWTPGYWAWGGDGFRFNDGYWAPQVGFLWWHQLRVWLLWRRYEAAAGTAADFFTTVQ